MKTIFTIIPDPKLKKETLIIRQDNPGPKTPAVVLPEEPEDEKDTAPPKPEPGQQPS